MSPFRTLLLGSLFAPLWLAVRQTASTYFTCQTTDFGKRVSYVSPLFPGTQDEQAKINADWHAMMKAKYGIQALPSQSCHGPYATTAQAEETRASFIKLRREQQKQPVEELNWTWNGRPAVVAGAPTPASAPAPAPAAAHREPTKAERDSALAEIPQAKGYCEVNLLHLRDLFTCDCFAQMVYHHRLTHPDESAQGKGERPHPPSIPTLMTGTSTAHLDCAECITDERLLAYVKAVNRVGVPGLPPRKLPDMNCIAKEMGKLLRAQPWFDRVQADYNLAGATCTGSRP